MAIKMIAPGKYKITIWSKTQTGSRQKREITVLGSRRKADRLHAKLKNDQRLGATLSPAKQKRSPRFDDFVSEWFETWVKAHNKPSEVDSKDNTIRNHLIPAFKRYRLAEITTEIVERFKTRQIAKYSPSTVNIHLACLRKCLGFAVETGKLEHNPMLGIKFLPTEARESYLERHELHPFLDAVPERWRPLFEVAVYTGLRKGELLALRWCDVDLDSKEIRVRHTIYKGKLGSPKTKASQRTLPMNPRVYEVLSALRPEEGGGLRYVFENAAGGPLGPHAVRAPLNAATLACGLERPLRFHDLRHTFASHCVMAGMPLRTLQDLLGHSTLRMVMRYAHVSEDHKRDAVDQVWRAMSNGKSTHFPLGQ